jgi:hypothetical protein
MAAPPKVQTLTAMAVDSNSIARHRLKQVCHSLDEFDQVDQASDLRAAQERLSAKHSRVDIVFISSKFPSAEVKEFTDWAKGLGVTQDAAFVILMEINQKGTSSDTKLFTLGGDGVLFEPFSTDQLREISALSMKVRKERTQQRLAVHLRSVVNDIFGMLGDISFLRESNFSFKPVISEMQKISTAMEGLESDETQIYFDALLERTEKGASERKVRPAHFRYKGKSKRARKRMQRKTLRALGYEATE